MPKPNSPVVNNQSDPDEDVFTSFGISDDDDKHRAKVLAAARVLAHRRTNPQPQPKLPTKKGTWGED